MPVRSDFRRLRVAASLKHRHMLHTSHCLDNFRRLRVAASLKPSHGNGPPGPVINFRRLRVAASLKLFKRLTDMPLFVGISAAFGWRPH